MPSTFDAEAYRAAEVARLQAIVDRQFAIVAEQRAVTDAASRQRAEASQKADQARRIANTHRAAILELQAMTPEALERRANATQTDEEGG